MTTQVQSAKTQQGFSLIELLVVVAIIGVLAAAGVVGYTSYLDNVKADTHRNNTLAIGKALSLNAVAKKGNLAVNPTVCSAATVEAADQSAKHTAMLTCVQAIANEAKFKTPFAGVTGDYVVAAPVLNSAFAIPAPALPAADTDPQCGTAAAPLAGKIVVHHQTSLTTTMATTIYACTFPKAGEGSKPIPDSVVKVDYLN